MTVLIWIAVVAVACLIAALLLSVRANARLRSGERAEARTDALTGLENRYGLFQALERELAGGSREKLVLAILDLDGFKTYNDTFGHPSGDALLRGLGGKLAAAMRGHGRAYRLGGDEFCVLARGDDRELDEIVAAARGALTEHGDGFAISPSCGVVRVPGHVSKASDALHLADQALYAEKAGRKGRVEHETRDVLLRILREREPAVADSGRDVAELAERTGRELGLDPETLDILIRAASLHDIGKVAIPEEVLSKPGPLDEAEWGMLRKHSVVGERILGAASAMAPVAKAVRSTHERWDGSGYPDGLRGEEIPLVSRVVLICDAYIAMTSRDRPYGDARTRDEALAELRANAGRQFDPDLVRVFCDLQSDAAASPKSTPEGSPK